MKKFTLLKSLFVVMALSLFSFSAVAEEVTYTYTPSEHLGSSTINLTTSEYVMNDDLTFTADKGSTNNNVAYNKSGELRLYASAADGNGCSITLNPKNGVTITKVVLNATTTSYTPTVKYSVDGGAETTGTWNETEMTFSSISAKTSFKFKNANTTNVQLRLKSIVVTYTTSGEEGGDIVEPEPDPEEPTPDPEEPEIVDDGTIFLANFNGEGENNKGTNSYTGEKQYTVSGVKFNLTYAESAITGSPLEGVGHIIARVAKNTTNTPTIVTEAVTVKGSTITNIGFIYKAKTEGATMNVYTSPASGAETWTSIYSIKPTTTLSRVDLPVSLGDDIKLKFEWVVETSTGSNRDYYLDSIYVKGSKPEGLVEKPVISPTSKDAVDPVEVTITAAAGEIRYTLNGEIPTAESTLYTAPFIVSTTTTVKAIAIVEGRLSDVTEVTYTFPIDVENIAAWITTATENRTTNVRITGEVVVTYVANNNTYIQDESGCLNVFDYDFDDLVASGSVVTNLVGKYGEYHGAVQLDYTPAAVPTIEAGDEVAPLAVNLDYIVEENLYRYVVVKNVELKAGVTFDNGEASNADLVNGDELVRIRSNYKNIEGTFNAGDKVDVTGIVSIYDGTVQLYIASISTSTSGPTTAVDVIETANIYTENGMIMAEGEFQIFTVTGQNVTDMNGNLANGVYVVRTANATGKVVIK